MRNVCEILGRFGKRISVGVFHIYYLKKKKRRKEKKKKRKERLYSKKIK